MTALGLRISLLVMAVLMRRLGVTRANGCYIGHNVGANGDPAHLASYTEDPCSCSSVQLGGVNVGSASRAGAAVTHVKELVIGEDAHEVQSLFDCPEQCSHAVKLGLEDGTIPDASITASSSYTDTDVSSPARGRLNRPDEGPSIVGAWAAALSDIRPWIQVDLGRVTYVHGVLLQGRAENNQWVTKYKVMYKPSPRAARTSVLDAAGNVQVFDGNTNRGSIVTTMFDQPILASLVRIYPVQGNGYRSMRFELLGCK